MILIFRIDIHMTYSYQISASNNTQTKTHLLKVINFFKFEPLSEYVIVIPMLSFSFTFSFTVKLNVIERYNVKFKLNITSIKLTNAISCFACES